MNKTLKKAAVFFTAVAAAVTLGGCTTTPPNGMVSYNFKEMSMDFIQLAGPKDGDKIAIFDTDYGEIRTVLYEQYAPETTAAFIKNAEDGKYNGIPVKGVSKDVYFLSGGEENSKGQYVGRQSNTELILNEYTPELWPFKGSLLGFSEQQGYSDSRWFFCNDDEVNNTESEIEELKSQALQKEDDVERSKMVALFDKFYEIGGVFGMAGEYTIFGQTYKGFDVVEKLANIPSDDNGMVTEEVMIKSVVISEFHDGDQVEAVPASHPKTASSDETGSDINSETDNASSGNE